MQSKKSFFNFGFFRKSCSRFAPLWILYFFIWILILPVGSGTSIRYLFFQSNADKAAKLTAYIMNSVYYGGLIMGFIFGIFSAMAVWSFLYSKRSCDGTACLPISRTALYVSAAASGLVPLIAANLLTALITLAVFASVPGIFVSIAIWFALNSLILLFFYSMAVFLAQLTGNIIALPVVYAIFNFLAVAFESVFKILFSEFLFGFTFSECCQLSFLSPPVEFAVKLWENEASVGVIYRYALAALVLLVLGCLIFRRRRMEAAGDVVAYNCLKPVSVILAGLGGGMGLGLILFYLFELSANNNPLLWLTVFMIIGAFIGCFASQMIIRKSFRVLGVSLPYFAITAVLCILFCLNCKLDYLGLENRLPNAGKIQEVKIAAAGDNTILCSPENIEKVLSLHGDIIAQKDTFMRSNDDESYFGSYWSVDFHYLLKNGKTFTRSYGIYGPKARDIIRELQNDIINCPEAIASRKELSINPEPQNIDSADIYITMTAKECADAAGYADAEEYIIKKQGWYTHDEIAAMSDEEYKIALGRVIAQNCLNIEASVSDYPTPAEEKYGSYYDSSCYAYPEAFENDESYYAYLGNSFDEDKMFFSYQLTLSKAEISDLYFNCILPDFESGVMGKIWLIDDDYNSKVAGGSILISLVSVNEETDETQWDSLTTFPVTEASKTGAFLAERGIKLHSIGEINSVNTEG